MPLHLIKLAVGCESVKELKGWVAERMATARKKGLPLRHVHITRMTPKRDEEILAGGSLYWVIRGEIAAREKIIAIEPFRDKDGIGRCRLVMQPKVIAVSPRPMRPFQGWRYLTADAAPADLTKSAASSVACDAGGRCAGSCATSGCSKLRYYRSAAWASEPRRHQHPHRTVLDQRRSAPASRRGGPRDSRRRSRRS